MDSQYQIAGNVHTVTFVVYNRLHLFVRPTYVLPLFDSLNYYRYQHAFNLLGYVVMPDHVHLVLWLYGEATIGDVMRDFKKFTSVRLIRQATVEGNSALTEAFSAAGEQVGRSEHKVWQDGFWDTHVYTERFLRGQLQYIHRNPVRARLVATPEAYPYSSYRNYVSGDDSLIEVDRGWG